MSPINIRVCDLIGDLTKISADPRLSAALKQEITKDCETQMTKHDDRSAANDRLHVRAFELYVMWEDIPTVVAPPPAPAPDHGGGRRY